MIRYAIKNKFLEDLGVASYGPNEISDDYEIPIVKTDSRNYILLNILKENELTLSLILDLLVFAMKNNLYWVLKSSSNNPIEILEEKLFNNILLLNENEYKMFSEYYLNIKEYEFSDKIFRLKKNRQLDNLKEILINDCIETKIEEFGVGNFIHNLIDFTDTEHSFSCLCSIKEKLPLNIYKNIIGCIFNNSNHILNGSQFITKEYNLLFKKEIRENIERENKIELVKEKMELVEKNDISLMLNTNAMIDELCKINDFLEKQTFEDNEESKSHKLYFLKHENIIRKISYEDINYNIPPIFSENAIKIIKYFNKNDTFDIESIINDLKNYWFKDEYFYIYFYWVYVKKSDNIDNSEMRNEFIANSDVIEKIRDNINKDVYDKFINNPLEHFEYYNSPNWLMPFLYYYETLLNNVPPQWMQIKHILKLIVVHCQIINIDYNLGLNWLINKFPTIKITSNQIVEYGLKVIESIKGTYSRSQIIKYFIDYYESNEKNSLTDEITNFIINTTKKLFDIWETNDTDIEFQDIDRFWTKCNLNFIDVLFPKFTVKIIISAIMRNNNSIYFQYRKSVLLYCSKIATNEQKLRIINDIEKDFENKTLPNEEIDEIHKFLASIGHEKSIKFIITSYLNGRSVLERDSFNTYGFGFIKQSKIMLKYFI
jgi:hypothetical protein